MRKGPVELAFIRRRTLTQPEPDRAMIVDCYDPVNLFEMVPKLNLEMEPELWPSSTGSWRTTPSASG